MARLSLIRHSPVDLPEGICYGRSDVDIQLDAAGLADLCPLAPANHIAHRGRWAAKAMPFVFGAMWLLALLGRLHD